MAGAVSLRERLVDVGRFVARPQFLLRPMAWGRAALIALAAVFALDMALDTLVTALLGSWDDGAGLLPAPLEQDMSLAEDLFTGLLVAPLLEELLFRGWLTGRRAALRFAVYGFTALALFAASLILHAMAFGLALAGAGVAFAGLIHWSRTRDRDVDVPAWFVRHFRWLVWGSSLLFGLIHLGNYEPVTHPVGLLVVLPQTIGGLLLAWTRTRLGLRAAMAHHAAYNAVLTALDYAGW